MVNEELGVYKIAIIGDVSVGKTSLVQRFLKDPTDCDRTKATVAYDFKVVTIIEDNKRIELHVFDCSGDRQFREVSSDAYKNVKGIIFVYDVSNHESFTNLQETWLKVADEFMEADNNCPIFVVANKIDLPKDDRTVEKEKGEKFATAQSASCFFETSAVAGQGVEKLFRDVAKTMVATWGGLHPTMSPEAKESIQAAQKEKKKRFKRVRRLFSCFRPCCSCKRKPRKSKNAKSPKECPTPMETLTHEGKTVINEEDVNVDLKDSEASHHSEEEENQETKPLREELENEVRVNSNDSEASHHSEEEEEEEEENQETKPLKDEVENEVGLSTGT